MRIPNETQQREKLLLFLREVRQKTGIRQVELAKKLGAQQSFVSKYEGGSRRLDILELRQICQVLGIPLGDFIRQMEERLDETK